MKTEIGIVVGWKVLPGTLGEIQTDGFHIIVRRGKGRSRPLVDRIDAGPQVRFFHVQLKRGNRYCFRIKATLGTQLVKSSFRCITYA